MGGGPAELMAGLLFARSGVRVRVIEKHNDFLHDFRGDTVHPSTLDVLNQLGILEAFLARPHQRLSRAELRIRGRDLVVGDLMSVRSATPFLAMMPQWDFLDFLRVEASRYPQFRLDLGAQGESVDPLLPKVQRRRAGSAKLIQRVQKIAQDRVLAPVLRRQMRLDRPPWPLLMLARFPSLRRIPGRAIGLGIRRERVCSPDAYAG